MLFQIEISTGEEGKVTLRGCADGTVEFCKWQDSTDKDTKEVTTSLVPYKYYADVSQAMNKIMRMRIGSTNVTTLKELVLEIKNIREDLKKEMGLLT